MPDKKALVVIDMQNDYLWPERQPKFTYPTEELVRLVNRAIDLYRAQGNDVLYVLQVFPNLPTNRRFIGFSIRGTAGAELYAGLKRTDGPCFEKNLPNAYITRAFREHMSAMDYTEIALCGLDECGCIAATARGAAMRGAKAVILENCTGTRFSPERVARTRGRLAACGVRYTRIE